MNSLRLVGFDSQGGMQYFPTTPGQNPKKIAIDKLCKELIVDAKWKTEGRKNKNQTGSLIANFEMVHNPNT